MPCRHRARGSRHSDSPTVIQPLTVIRPFSVIPAKAGIQAGYVSVHCIVIPAKAGTHSAFPAQRWQESAHQDGFQLSLEWRWGWARVSERPVRYGPGSRPSPGWRREVEWPQEVDGGEKKWDDGK